MPIPLEKKDYKGTNLVNEHNSSTGHNDPTKIKKNLNPPPAFLKEKMKNSIDLQDSEIEGKPTMYLFVFVNPLSGDQKGTDLVHLPIQNFRLRRFPQVQVEIHNILDDQDRNQGIKNIQLVQSMVDMLPSVVPVDEKNEDIGKISKAAQSRHIHIWSAGGDGTVMSVFELLVSNRINLDLIFFSCIPFGTGNDFSQVLGWGRTIPDKDIVGSKLTHLESLISERLERSEAARLDIWEIKMTSYPSGYVREAGPKERRDGHDVAEVKAPYSGQHELTRKMSNYMSIGVQGYVGSGFEAHRAGNRLVNMFVYAQESSKWVFWRKFPNLNDFIQNISQDGQVVLEWPTAKERKIGVSSEIPQLANNPIDFVIQNIPHIWGREVDLWGEAESGLESVCNRSGPTDPNHWKPQRANDGRLELMTIENMLSYLKKLANIRQHVSRLAQLDTPFDINFRPPEVHQKEVEKVSAGGWEKTKALLKDKRRHKYEKKNTICIMCDGEFYEIKDPKAISFNRFAQIWTLGYKDDSGDMGRLVRDELDSYND
ncbi:hypothetical protein G6F57_005438 [Rhizopus arrhizus]|uniref:diacylglycerol kinase (ATP) n=1 Tax=Rhizopus oryzae TaxID=64495 RepID=A0A9P7BR62_RHIOR|nr:hypothetical protein G6F23_002675 [Rhizopus arrhizus]KAG0760523.1 hypothetical protein G6F24_008246 [Rhizopus arrhizus]KAG0782881.1 hypothetical protein G6F22_008915 [Rhizopus arrhizus]KAG0787973.1 hypothetical protein G6F21_007534 [Rhizopus arrhizus]KAG0809480.1 hypothetical protein G6F20_008739 [Rhizopus arrhizus]